MTIDSKIRDKKNCNKILTEKQQKYQHYHLEKLININKQRQIIEETKIAYLPLGKVFQKLFI